MQVQGISASIAAPSGAQDALEASMYHQNWKTDIPGSKCAGCPKSCRQVSRKLFAASLSHFPVGHSVPSPVLISSVLACHAQLDGGVLVSGPSRRGGSAASIAFKDYAPQVFRRVRTLFGVADRDYMLSLGPEQILGELMLVNSAYAAASSASIAPRTPHLRPL